MTAGAILLQDLIGELSLFAAIGFLVFALDDLLVDLIYFARTVWRAQFVYNRYPRAFADALSPPRQPGRMAVFVPAWDEASVIAPMLRATLKRFDHGDFRLYVGHYRNDPATEAAIRSVDDARVRLVRVDADGPTSKADCLNHLWAALVVDDQGGEAKAKAIVLHDAEDLVHPLELKLFDRLVERAAVVQLPVLPLLDPQSRWIAGHYADEFAEAHIKQLVVRSARRSRWPGSAARSSARRWIGCRCATTASRSPHPA